MIYCIVRILPMYKLNTFWVYVPTSLCLGDKFGPLFPVFPFSPPPTSGCSKHHPTLCQPTRNVAPPQPYKAHHKTLEIIKLLMKYVLRNSL